MDQTLFNLMGIKDHPFGVEAFFRFSLVLTFAAPVNALRKFVPSCVEVDDLHGETGFLAIALVQTVDLRPKGFPKFMGTNFFLAGYRIFTRYRTSEGKRLRGLYILKSETNKHKMKWLGDLFTRYKYDLTKVDITIDAERARLTSSASRLNVTIAFNEHASLPEGSPFKDWKEARRFAGPLPFTFSFDKKTNDVLIVEGVREDWIPMPVEVTGWESGFISSLDIEGIRLASAFIVRDIPYSWKKGRRDPWMP